MPLITAAELQEIKSRIDLARLIRADGVALESTGKDLVGRCPFHDDRTPSLVVTPAKGLWHCMGACDTGGSAIDWMMKRHSLGFRQAVDALREIMDPAAESPEPAPYAASAESVELFTRVIDHYHRALTQNPRAVEYLEGRGLMNHEAFARFRIGYADRTLGSLLPHGATKAGGHQRALLRRIGLLRDPSGQEHFAGCIVVPIFDANGLPCAMYGRLAGDKTKRSIHRYLPGPQRGIFNREAYTQGELILTESIFDALTFYVHGLRNVSCAYGTNGFTDEMFALLKDAKVRRLCIAYDMDQAGASAAKKLAERLAAELPELDVRRVRFPLGLDPNEFARRTQDAAGELRELVANAVPARGHLDRPAPDPSPAKVAETAGPRTPNAAGPEYELRDSEVRFRYADRAYRVRGLFRNSTDHIMKINLRVGRGDTYHLDTFDLLSAKARQYYIDQAAKEITVDADIIKYDLGRILDRLEELQTERLKKTLKPEKRAVEIPPERRERALAYGRDPELIQNILRDFERAGLVGERTNALLGYLGTVSRRTDSPLAIIIQSSSAAGKSTLMEALLAFVPEEDRIKYSMMTGQSLFYMQSQDLKHRIIAISEEEGVERAKYAIKILQSEGRITIATTIKDAETGLPDTKEFAVEGPVMILITTTNVEIDEELQNRSVIVAINEAREQTARIQAMQRASETLEGIIQKKDAAHVTELHQDFQRTLRPLVVVNPFADQIEFPDAQLRLRRDQKKFLILIRAVALLHQHQRKVKDAVDGHGARFEYIEATREDVALAAYLMGRVFGHGVDDMAPPTRAVLDRIREFVRSESARGGVAVKQFRFTCRVLREHLGLSDRRMRVHLGRLSELEYLLVHGGGQGRLAQYELLYSDAPAGVNGNWPAAAAFPLSSELLVFLGADDVNFGARNPNFGARKGNFVPASSTLRPPSGASARRSSKAGSAAGSAKVGKKRKTKTQSQKRILKRPGK